MRLPKERTCQLAALWLFEAQRRSLVELLHAGGDELLRDDSTRLAERASAAGCDATIEVWPEMQHVFQIAAGNVPESDSAVAKLGAWLSNRLAD